MSGLLFGRQKSGRNNGVVVWRGSTVVIFFVSLFHLFLSLWNLLIISWTLKFNTWSNRQNPYGNSWWWGQADRSGNLFSKSWYALWKYPGFHPRFYSKYSTMQSCKLYGHLIPFNFSHSSAKSREWARMLTPKRKECLSYGKGARSQHVCVLLCLCILRGKPDLFNPNKKTS